MRGDGANSGQCAGRVKQGRGGVYGNAGVMDGGGGDERIFSGGDNEMGVVDNATRLHCHGCTKQESDGDRGGAFTVIALLVVLAISFWPAFSTITTVAPVYVHAPTPLGYTWSNLVFVLPSLLLLAWLAGNLGAPTRLAILYTLILLPMTGFLLDLGLASRLFVFPNASAILGPVVHGWDPATSAFTFPIPIEEFIFYVTGFQFVLLVYVWSNESWLARYKPSAPNNLATLPSSACAPTSGRPNTTSSKSPRGFSASSSRSVALAKVAFVGTLVFAGIACKTTSTAHIAGTNAEISATADTNNAHTHIGVANLNAASPVGVPHVSAENAGTLPEYFLFLVASSVAPCIAVYPRVADHINWRALSFTMLVLLLVSVVWEVTLGVRHGWWGYRGERMLGVFIAPWHNLPIEAVMTWVLVTFSTVFTYEFILSRTRAGRVGATDRAPIVSTHETEPKSANTAVGDALRSTSNDPSATTLHATQASETVVHKHIM
jgi:hypothetical protein